MIVLGVEDLDYVPSLLAVAGSNGFTGFLTLTGERILGDVTEQVCMEDGMDLHR